MNLDPMRGTKAMVLAAMALCTVGSLYGAKADDKNNGGLRIAVVDPQRLINEGQAYQSKVADIQKAKTNAETELQVVSNNFLLTENEQGDLTRLFIKEGSKQELTGDEKNRKTALLGKERTTMDEFENLSRTPAGQMTPQQDARLKELIKMREDAARRVQERGSTVENDLKSQLSNTTRDTLKTVHDTLAKVAKEKGFNLVLSNEVAWYADADLTDETLKQINKKQ